MWMKYPLMEFLSTYVIIMIDESNDIVLENMRIISKLLNKWNKMTTDIIKIQNRKPDGFSDNKNKKYISSISYEENEIVEPSSIQRESERILNCQSFFEQEDHCSLLDLSDSNF
ncbi:hypothetical protein EDI_224020 [Entamoeba dispar SAW760]|uniref:Uncharacterized protein n=1 Tax=Entamoeba dispar (strain ATCC PRA-260 / SAW760) TaxID=370354 RepID=B0EFH5_ENTDS|nr:uncharacterized protein EDI_224020 [Entamoeba dispar SAW760]EDR26721.1 hypothetical protein EDI_224020 [Entamoeba dispar SAW760]|eukprot:EDR26721.1 hypothetical protein EDI_224020 [Entamoeba dispar SAW760]